MSYEKLLELDTPQQVFINEKKYRVIGKNPNKNTRLVWQHQVGAHRVANLGPSHVLIQQ